MRICHDTALKKILFTLLLPYFLFATELDLIKTTKSIAYGEAEAEPQISKEYYRGDHLIYDCEGKYFACVDSFSFNLCSKKRTMALETNENNLPCTEFVKYSSQAECNDYARLFRKTSTDKKFCFNENYLKNFTIK